MYIHNRVNNLWDWPSEWREADVLGKYRELAAAYHSSDDEPLASALANKVTHSLTHRQPINVPTAEVGSH
jgi:hypothetical protein